MVSIIQREVQKFVLELMKNEQFKKKLLFEYDSFEAESKSKASYFYVLDGGNGLFKIGYSASLKTRFKAYIAANPMIKIDFLFKSKHAFKYEAACISKYSLDGSEWIKLTPNQLEEIKEFVYKAEITGSFD